MSETSAIELMPADRVSLAELTATFNRVYADYYVPLHLDETTQAFMIDVCDLVPAASRIARRAGETVAVALLGVRGTRDRKSTRLNSSHSELSRMPSSA